MGSFSLPDFNNTDSNTDSPADTCGCRVPEGLKMSLVFFTTTRKELGENSSISVQFFAPKIRERRRKLEVNTERERKKEKGLSRGRERERWEPRLKKIKGLNSSPIPESKTQKMWRKGAICAAVTLTKLEPTCSGVVGTCVLAIRAIKIPLHSATTEIVSLFCDFYNHLSCKFTMNDAFTCIKMRTV